MPVTINGSNTPTAGGVVYGDGTNYVSTSAGTSGQLLQSNGSSAPSWVAAPTGGFSNLQVFTSSGTFTVPAGITKVKVTVVGGGGGANDNWYYVGGGGGGAAIKVISGLTPGSTVTVTVGAGGSANNDGGTSSFGAYCSATGGAKGPGSGVTGASGGIGSNGDLNIKGQGSGNIFINGQTVGSAGGSSIFGGGGYGSQNAVGQAGGAYGGGGGGGNSGPGAGAAGVVIVEY